MNQELSSLPKTSLLKIEYLAASFNNVTNSYKFYWFLAILDHVRETQERTIPIPHLLARMVANVWYPTNYFRLSFGKLDRLSQITLALKEQSHLPLDAKKGDVIAAVLAILAQPTPFGRQILSLANYVPTRFLRPFLAEALRGQAGRDVDKLTPKFAAEAFESTSPCLYRFGPDGQTIEIHPRWFDYLQTHLPIITGFSLWHLHGYLQRNNPNVPNISAKLFAPEQRNLNHCRQFWQVALAGLGEIICIYSGQPMSQIESLDHFLPWSFVTHDLLWNIVPTPRTVNSVKSDQLPHFSHYFDPFAQLQYDAFQVVARSAKQKLLEEYVLLFKTQTVQDVATLPAPLFKSVLHDTLAPQLQIARNMGFAPDWRYSCS